MNDKPLPRPPKVTVACLFIGLTCGFLLLQFISTLSQWGSIELQEQVAEALDGPVGVDLSVDTVLSWLRVLLNVLAAGAAAGIVLAVYAARGHQASRVLLTVTAALLALVFVSVGLLGLLPAAFAIGCAFYLWSPEARTWYAAKNGRVTAAPTPPRPDPFAAPPAGATADSQRTAVTPAGPPAPQQAQQPYPVQPWRGPAATAARRPASVLTAAIVMLSSAGVVAAVAGLNALLYLVSPDEYVRLLQDQPLMADSVRELNTDAETLARWMFIGCSILTVVSLLGALAGGLLLARVKGSRVFALVMCAVTFVVGLAAVPMGWPWAAAAALVVWWITRQDARAWLSSR
ncbi:hypothetical protein [Aeromicrobium sp. IC_218]|uniref:hypothetical protein n=1 Tax=Aeromicrobium sp. IC_218 TaxID=2545468 RepID=UPI0010386697|nr:hypothetical protein [Aeromicrobium sp. IC_218]TCI99513.1 hypothetical protein E0W78_07205 [Aeromicrobium sp. IC_218]